MTGDAPRDVTPRGVSLAGFVGCFVYFLLLLEGCTMLLLLLLLCKSLYDVVFSGQPLRRGEREPPTGPLPHRRHGEIQGPVSQDL